MDGIAARLIRGGQVKLDLKAPHTVYRSKKGARLRGVTTILGELAKPQLMGWYAGQEREGVLAYTKAARPLPVKKDGEPLWFAEMKRDSAADLGTITHFRCECWLKGEPAEAEGIPPDLWSDSEHGFNRFRKWWEAEGFFLIESEKAMVYEDDGMAFGGTADIVARDGLGRFHLIDLKTTKASPYWPYPETLAQAATYAGMLEKIGTPVNFVTVARIGKTVGDELQIYRLSGDERRRGFDLFRCAYDAGEAKRDLEGYRH